MDITDTRPLDDLIGGSGVTKGRRAALVELGRVLGRAIDDGPSDRDLASLTRRYLQVMDELADLPDNTVKGSSTASARTALRAVK